MKDFPPIPHVDDVADEVLDRGHLWIQERIDGDPLRFRIRNDGLIRFGDDRTVFDPEAVPLRYRHAVRHVRERLDRDALREAVEDVASIVFFGRATQRRTIDYEWERTPSFLGCDVWVGTDGTGAERDGRFLPPDRVAQVYRRLGLEPVNAFEREVHVRDFHPGTFEVPDSKWYDGPAAGVVVRNKRGQRAVLPNSEFDSAGEHEIGGKFETEGDHDPGDVSPAGTGWPADVTPEDVAERYGTDDRFQRIAARVGERGETVTVEALAELALEGVAREAPRRVVEGRSAVDPRALRSALATRATRFLDGGE